MRQWIQFSTILRALRVLKVGLITVMSFQISCWFFIFDAPAILDELELAISGVLNYSIVVVPLGKGNR